MLKCGLDVDVIGRGRPMVLLHSLLSERTSFLPLASRLGDRRCIMVDLPGYGASPVAPAGLDVFADKVAELFDDLDMPADTEVLGNGFGGFVALALASRHGDRFGRLVLVGSAVAFPEAGRATFRTLADKVEQGGMAAVVDAAMNRMFPQSYIAARPDVVAERRAAFEMIDPGVFAAACKLLAGMDLAAELARIRNPTLVVVGSEDGATPPALGGDLADKLPDGRFIAIPGLGHAPHIQDPEAFIAAITPFLGMQPANSGHEAVA